LFDFDESMGIWFEEVRVRYLLVYVMGYGGEIGDFVCFGEGDDVFGVVVVELLLVEWFVLFDVVWFYVNMGYWFVGWLVVW